MLGLSRHLRPIIALLASTAAYAAPSRIVASVDLAKPFETRSPWRFTATQGPDLGPDDTPSGSDEPGTITLCISKDKRRSCRPDLGAALHDGRSDDFYADAHFLAPPRIVHPHGRAASPLLLIDTASWHGGNGDQRVALQALVYDRARDVFVRVYADRVNKNTNDEIRYIESGPLRGAIVSAEPTQDAPFGFWITVSRITPDNLYRQALHYRSATHYGDGNPLAVIDSEMPNIQQRLGFWHPGSLLPLPRRHCARPHLVRMELWCDTGKGQAADRSQARQ